MNYINRIEILGRIGSLRINELTTGTVASFSVVTDYLYRTADGNAVCESTWFNVSAYQSSLKSVDVKSLKKGDPIHVKGRMRCSKYTLADGTERQFYEIIASDVEAVREDFPGNYAAAE